MSCAREPEVLLLDSEWAGSDRAALEAHARDCDHCGPLISTLRLARSAARAQPVLSAAPEARARVWAHLEAPPSTSIGSGWPEENAWRRLGGWWLAAPLAAAVIVVFALRAPQSSSELAATEQESQPGLQATTSRATEPALAQAGAGKRSTLAAGERLRAGAAEVSARAPSTLLVSDSLVRLELGAADFWVTPLPDGQVFVVQTPHAQIWSMDARFAVLASSTQTELVVSKGDVRVRASGVDRTMKAGERILLSPSQGAEATDEMRSGSGASDQIDPKRPSADGNAVLDASEHHRIPTSDRHAGTSRGAALNGAPSLERGPAEQAGSERGASMPAAGRDAVVLERGPAEQAGSERGASMPAAGRDAVVLELGAPRHPLDDARAALATDPERASVLARRVLQRSTPPEIEVGALAVLADAHRRSARRAEAADAYARVAQHPSGAAYAEEAWYQRARLLQAMGRPKEALADLARAVPSAALLPERLVLEAELHDALGDRDAADRSYAQAIRAANEAQDAHSAREIERKRRRLQ